MTTQKYEDNSDNATAGSYYPVAINVAETSPNSRALDVTLDVAADIFGVPLTISGVIAPDTVACSDGTNLLTFDSPGTNRVRLTVVPPWESRDLPWGVAGDIAWHLMVTPNKGQLADQRHSSRVLRHCQKPTFLLQARSPRDAAAACRP